MMGKVLTLSFLLQSVSCTNVFFLAGGSQLSRLERVSQALHHTARSVAELNTLIRTILNHTAEEATLNTAIVYSTSRPLTESAPENISTSFSMGNLSRKTTSSISLFHSSPIMENITFTPVQENETTTENFSTSLAMEAFSGMTSSTALSHSSPIMENIALTPIQENETTTENFSTSLAMEAFSGMTSSTALSHSSPIMENITFTPIQENESTPENISTSPSREAFSGKTTSSTAFSYSSPIMENITFTPIQENETTPENISTSLSMEAFSGKTTSFNAFSHSSPIMENITFTPIQENEIITFTPIQENENTEYISTSLAMEAFSGKTSSIALSHSSPIMENITFTPTYEVTDSYQNQSVINDQTTSSTSLYRLLTVQEMNPLSRESATFVNFFTSPLPFPGSSSSEDIVSEYSQRSNTLHPERTISITNTTDQASTLVTSQATLNEDINNSGSSAQDNITYAIGASTLFGTSSLSERGSNYTSPSTLRDISPLTWTETSKASSPFINNETFSLWTVASTSSLSLQNISTFTYIEDNGTLITDIQPLNIEDTNSSYLPTSITGSSFILLNQTVTTRNLSLPVTMDAYNQTVSTTTELVYVTPTRQILSSSTNSSDPYSLMEESFTTLNPNLLNDLINNDTSGPARVQSLMNELNSSVSDALKMTSQYGINYSADNDTSETGASTVTNVPTTSHFISSVISQFSPWAYSVESGNVTSTSLSTESIPYLQDTVESGSGITFDQNFNTSAATHTSVSESLYENVTQTNRSILTAVVSLNESSLVTSNDYEMSHTNSISSAVSDSNNLIPSANSTDLITEPHPNLTAALSTYPVLSSQSIQSSQYTSTHEAGISVLDTVFLNVSTEHSTLSTSSIPYSKAINGSLDTIPFSTPDLENLTVFTFRHYISSSVSPGNELSLSAVTDNNSISAQSSIISYTSSRYVTPISQNYERKSSVMSTDTTSSAIITPATTLSTLFDTNITSGTSSTLTSVFFDPNITLPSQSIPEAEIMPFTSTTPESSQYELPRTLVYDNDPTITPITLSPSLGTLNTRLINNHRITVPTPYTNSSTEYLPGTILPLYGFSTGPLTANTSSNISALYSEDDVNLTTSILSGTSETPYSPEVFNISNIQGNYESGYPFYTSRATASVTLISLISSAVTATKSPRVGSLSSSHGPHTTSAISVPQTNTEETADSLSPTFILTAGPESILPARVTSFTPHITQESIPLDARPNETNTEAIQTLNNQSNNENSQSTVPLSTLSMVPTNHIISQSFTSQEALNSSQTSEDQNSMSYTSTNELLSYAGVSDTSTEQTNSSPSTTYENSSLVPLGNIPISSSSDQQSTLTLNASVSFISYERNLSQVINGSDFPYIHQSTITPNIHNNQTYLTSPVSYQSLRNNIYDNSTFATTKPAYTDDSTSSATSIVTSNMSAYTSENAPFTNDSQNANTSLSQQNLTLFTPTLNVHTTDQDILTLSYSFGDSNSTTEGSESSQHTTDQDLLILSYSFGASNSTTEGSESSQQRSTLSTSSTPDATLQERPQSFVTEVTTPSRELTTKLIKTESTRRSNKGRRSVAFDDYYRHIIETKHKRDTASIFTSAKQYNYKKLVGPVLKTRKYKKVLRIRRDVLQNTTELPDIEQHTLFLENANISCKDRVQELTWWERVNATVKNIAELLAAVKNGSIDEKHANQLEEEASSLDELVAEGYNITQLVEDVSEEDMEIMINRLSSVEDVVHNTSLSVESKIEKKRHESAIIIISGSGCIFLAFIVIMVVAKKRPWRRAIVIYITDNKRKRRINEAVHVYLDTDSLGMSTGSFTSYADGQDFSDSSSLDNAYPMTSFKEQLA
ncbi:hypothetical protein SK128_011125 [Halocaridina rubra]|uniref:Uncharacterized protein n=1 Tax=Halocaridina rubra TaxID=373956 RepID=A0AAN8XE26_HALRR